MLSILKKIFVASLLLSTDVYAGADYLDPTGMTQVMDGFGYDDATHHISLSHTFPYYGGVFSDAWMSSNGFIILYDPTTQYGNSNTSNNACCSGFNPQGNSALSYIIAPLWTDLVDKSVGADSGYFYETEEGGSSFLWYNLHEYYNNNTNTFQLNMWPDGSFDFIYDEVDITNHSVWVGFTGDTTSQNSGSYDEVTELMYTTRQQGMTEFDIDFHDATFDGGRAWYGEDGGYGAVDCSNPINDSSCPGYEQAYTDQQCSSDPLYDSSCSGYQEAYFDQQCTDDALYDSQCDGYASAWIDDQCEGDPLFAESCAGYAAARIQDDQMNESMNGDQFFGGQDDMGYDDDQDYMGGPGPSDGPSDDGVPPQDGGYDQPNDQNFSDPMPDDLFAIESNMDAGAVEPDQYYDPEPPEELSFPTTPQQPFDNNQSVAVPEPEYQQPIEPIVREEIHHPEPESVEVDPIELHNEEPDLPAEEPQPERIVLAEDPIAEEVILTEVDAEVSVLAPLDNPALDPVKKSIASPTTVKRVLDMLETDKQKASERNMASVNQSVAAGSRQSNITGNSQTSNSGGQLTSSASGEQQRTAYQQTGGDSQQSSSDSQITTGPAGSQQYQSQAGAGKSINTYTNESDTRQHSEAVHGSIVSEEQLGYTSSSDSQNDSSYGNQDLFAVSSTAGTTVLQNQSSIGSSQDDEMTVDVEQDSFATVDAMFDTQVNEAFSTGANISVVLSGARPDFNKFDVKPPSTEQAMQSKKVESLAETMSEKAIQQNAERMKEDVQESGGFQDQTVAVTLINYVPGFTQYKTQSLKKATSWYRSKSIYKGNGNVDNSMSLYIMAGQTEQRHKQMVLEQYGR